MCSGTLLTINLQKRPIGYFFLSFFFFFISRGQFPRTGGREEEEMAWNPSFSLSFFFQNSLIRGVRTCERPERSLPLRVSWCLGPFCILIIILGSIKIMMISSPLFRPLKVPFKFTPAGLVLMTLARQQRECFDVSLTLGAQRVVAVEGPLLYLCHQKLYIVY